MKNRNKNQDSNQTDNCNGITNAEWLNFKKLRPGTTKSDTIWMLRCMDLARRGLGRVSPNPPVGALLVHEGRILGEGYHAYYGGPHAEVEAVRDVSDSDRHLIPHSTLYVSLEPCCITGKTPPCTELIIREGIRDVRISTKDPNPAVAGSGIASLRSHGISVVEGILEDEGKELIRSFATNILLHRPHIVLKWAQSKHGYIGKKGEQIWLSDPLTKVWSHSQRTVTDAIIVGARTVETDNPSLTTRSYPGRSPQRVIYDINGKLHDRYEVFKNDGIPVFYFSAKINEGISVDHIQQVIIQQGKDPVAEMLNVLFQNQIGSVLVEGGAYMHDLFIDRNLWDEAWVIQTRHTLDSGIVAPNVRGRLLDKICSGTDTIVGIQRNN